jgi:hypothetical protein
MKRPHAAVVALLLLFLASSAAAGVARISGMDFKTLDDAVLHFWQECQRSPRSFHGCFVGPFADYPDRRFHPCDRVPGSRAEKGKPETELPREVVDWLGYERILRERRGEIGIDKYGFDPNSIGGRREEAIEIHLGPEERFGPEIRFPPKRPGHAWARDACRIFELYSLEMAERGEATAEEDERFRRFQEERRREPGDPKD